MKFSESTEVDISLMVKESSFNLEPMIKLESNNFNILKTNLLIKSSQTLKEGNDGN